MRPVLLFSALTLLLSWTYWLGVIASQRGWLAVSVPLTPFGAFGPALAAIAITGLLDGRRGVGELLRSIAARPVPWRTLGISVLAWPSFVLIALLFAGLLGQPLWPTAGLPLTRLLLGVVEVFLLTALAEELGWRGFLLPQLLTRVRPAVAATVVGGIWALWHLPLFYILGTAQASIPFGLFVINILAASFIYTAFFLRSRPSLLPVLTLHTLQDVSLGIAPALWPAAGTSAVFWYAYFAVVLAVGLGAAGRLIARPPTSSPAVA